jgi:hypothetical protein
MPLPKSRVHDKRITEIIKKQAEQPVFKVLKRSE